MAIRFIQASSVGKRVLSGSYPDVFGVEGDESTGDILYQAPGDATPRVVPQLIDIRVGIDANTVDGNVFIADAPYQVTAISEAHSTAGNDGSAVTLDVKKCAGTTAPASGTSLFASTTINLKGTANTVQSPTLTGTVATLKLATGDRLAFDATGTLTALAGGVVVISLKRISTS